MCRRTLEPPTAHLPARPLDVNECGRCAMAVGRARRRVRKLVRKATSRTAALPRQRTSGVLDPQATDRPDQAGPVIPPPS